LNSEDAQNKEEDNKETSNTSDKEVYNIEHVKVYSTPIGA